MSVITRSGHRYPCHSDVTDLCFVSTDNKLSEASGGSVENGEHSEDGDTNEDESEAVPVDENLFTGEDLDELEEELNTLDLDEWRLHHSWTTHGLMWRTIFTKSYRSRSACNMHPHHSMSRDDTGETGVDVALVLSMIYFVFFNFCNSTPKAQWGEGLFLQQEHTSDIYEAVDDLIFLRSLLKDLITSVFVRSCLRSDPA